MNQITLFTYENTNVRTTTTEDGTPLFCALDIATTLGYSDPKDALDRHCKGIALHYPIVDSLGRTQEARFISEGDVYRLIFNSKLPTAEKFEAWVVDEVLPSIRKHGMYATPASIKDMGPNKFCRRLLDNNFAFRNGHSFSSHLQDKPTSQES